jgi:hypothetical protein
MDEIMMWPFAPNVWREPVFWAGVFATTSVVCTIVGYGSEFVLWLLKS